MKLKALDQVHVSSVQADSLRPGQEFEVSAATGKELLKVHPNAFEMIEDEPAEVKAEPVLENKAEPAAPANKAAGPKGKKGK